MSPFFKVKVRRYDSRGELFSDSVGVAYKEQLATVFDWPRKVQTVRITYCDGSAIEYERREKE